MAHKRIGDRADHPRRASAEPLRQLVFEKDHPRLVVHAVIGDQADAGAQFDKAPHPVVDRAVKGVRLGRARRVGMLDIIGQGQIEQARRPAVEQP